MIKYILLFLLASNFSAVIDNKYAIQYEKIKKTTFFEFSKNNIFKLASSGSMIIGGAMLGYLFWRRNINSNIILDKASLINLGILLGAVSSVSLGGYTMYKDYKSYKNILIHAGLSYNLTNIITPILSQSNTRKFLTKDNIRDISENIKIYHNLYYANNSKWKIDSEFNILSSSWFRIVFLLLCDEKEENNNELNDILNKLIIQNECPVKINNFEDLNKWKNYIKSFDFWNKQDLENREYKKIFNILYRSIFRIMIYSRNYKEIINKKLDNDYWETIFSDRNDYDNPTGCGLARLINSECYDSKWQNYLKKSYFDKILDKIYS